MPGATDNIGFLLAKASQAWNERLAEEFARNGFAEVRPAYGSILVPLFDEEGLQIVELARRASLAKQTLTTQLRALEECDLIERREDPSDGRAFRIFLTAKGRVFKTVALQILDELDGEASSLLPGGLTPLRQELQQLTSIRKEKQ